MSANSGNNEASGTTEFTARLPASARLNRLARNQAKRLWLQAFLLLERAGVHVTPVHWYSGLPNVSFLAKHRDLWIRRSQMPGIKMDADAQMATLERLCKPYRNEYAGLRVYAAAIERSGEHGYGPIESQALHGLMRALKPRRVLQVGCGVSTYCMLAASELNERPTAITCIEPYPNAPLRGAREIRLVEQMVQAVALDEFSKLQAGDVLFIDSTHVVQVGSDVNYVVLEILPRLADGVIVHFHDIMLPYEYTRGFLGEITFPLETSLVRAFMTGNEAVDVIACLSLLHYDHPARLRELFPDYAPQHNDEGLVVEGGGPHFPSSLWFQIRRSSSSPRV